MTGVLYVLARHCPCWTLLEFLERGLNAGCRWTVVVLCAILDYGMALRILCFLLLSYFLFLFLSLFLSRPIFSSVTFILVSFFFFDCSCMGIESLISLLVAVALPSMDSFVILLRFFFFSFR